MIEMEFLVSRLRLVSVCEPFLQPIRTRRVRPITNIWREMRRCGRRTGVLRPRDRQISFEGLPFRLIVRNPGLHWMTKCKGVFGETPSVPDSGYLDAGRRICVSTLRTVAGDGIPVSEVGAVGTSFQASRSAEDIRAFWKAKRAPLRSLTGQLRPGWGAISAEISTEELRNRSHNPNS